MGKSYSSISAQIQDQAYHELPPVCVHLKEPLEHDIQDLVLLVDIVQLC